MLSPPAVSAPDLCHPWQYNLDAQTWECPACLISRKGAPLDGLCPTRVGDQLRIVHEQGRAAGRVEERSATLERVAQAFNTCSMMEPTVFLGASMLRGALLEQTLPETP